MPAMNRPLAALGFTLGCSAPLAADKDAQPLRFELTPGKIHEECLRLEAGDKRKYNWKSSVPVDFNVHYHKGAEVFYPVKMTASKVARGTFTARTGEDYCWMWTAKDVAAAVEGEIR